MSTPGTHLSRNHGGSLEEPRETVLERAQLFPRYEEMVVDGLSDEEEESFLAAVTDE